MNKVAQHSAESVRATSKIDILDHLDRQIIAALQVNGRAGWRQIASVLGAPERTIASRGAELLRTEHVKIGAFAVLPQGGVLDQSLITLRFQSGRTRIAATSIASREDTVFTFLTNGEIDCVFEMVNSRNRMLSVLLEELPAIRGVKNLTATTVIKLYKPSFDWVPSVLTAQQGAALRNELQSQEPLGAVELAPMDREDQEIARVLSLNGRATFEELARATALSQASARRRFVHLQRSGRLYTRTLAEPESMGLPVLAVLRVRTKPKMIDHVARLLMARPEVRYLAFVTGPYQLFVELVCESQSALSEFLYRDDWTTHSLQVDTSMVIQAMKRAGARREFPS